MKKRSMLVMALTLTATIIMSSFPVFAAAPKVDGKYFDDFERPSAKLTTDGNGGPIKLTDGTTIWWNGTYDDPSHFSIVDGALHINSGVGDRYREGTNVTDPYKYVVLRIKGDADAVAHNADITVVMGNDEGVTIGKAEKQVHFNALLGPDGKVVSAISTEWQDIVIDVQKNNFVLGGGKTNDFMIQSYAKCQLDIDYIYMTNTDPNATVPVVQHDVKVNYVKEDGSAASSSITAKVNDKDSYKVSAKTIDGYTCTGYKVDSATTVTSGTNYNFTNVTANHSITFIYKANPTPPPVVVTPADPEAIVSTGALIDNFDRSKLDASGGITLTDKGNTKIYWNMFGPGSQSIFDGILHAQFAQGGYYRLATNNTNSWKYLVLRVKGDSRTSSDKIYLRMGPAEKHAIDDGQAGGDKTWAQLKGPDGKPLPKITSSWQNIVIDVSKSGFSFGGGSNGFQIGTWQAMNMDIDFVLMTNTIPNPGTGDSLPVAAAALALAAAAALVVLTRKKAEL